MNINSLYNIFSHCLVAYRLKFLVFASALLLFGFNGYGQATVAFSSAANSDQENTGANLPTLFVTGTVASATSVTVTNTGTGTAASGVDYTFTSPQVVNIPVGVYDGTTATEILIPTLTITNDAVVEPNETVILGLIAATGDATLSGIVSTTYTINNDDSVTVAFSSATGSGPENTGANLPTLFVTGTVASATSVTVTNTGTGTATSGVDYTFTSPQVVNIPAGVYDGTTATDIPIPTLTITNDAVVEPNETIILGLSAATGDATLGGIVSTTYTINNDDSVTVAFSSATGSGPENTGANLPTLFVTGTVASATSVTVTNTGTGTATSGVDYTFTSPQVVNIPAGVYDGTTATEISIPTLTITNDAGVEPNETIILGLSAATGDATLGGIVSTTYTINNDDSVTVAFSSATGSGPENTGANLPTLFVTGTVASATSVTVTNTGTGTATSGVDYTFTSPQVVNIPAGVYDGTTATEISIPTLTITNDAGVEPNETIILGLIAATGDATLGGIVSTTYTINNDDSVTVAFSSATGSGPENTGANLPTLFVTGTVASVTSVTVTNTGTGTATSGVDYTFTSPQVVNIPAGVYDGTTATEISIPTLTITNDAGVEPNETIILGLSAATGDATLGGIVSTTYTINNDDSDVMTMGAGVALTEGNAGITAFNFTANRTGATTSAATVTYTVTGVSADAADFDGGVFPTGLATFAIGSSTAAITINVSGDTAIEANETFTVTLSAPSAGYTLGAPSNATGTINNDDSYIASIAATDAAASESPLDTGTYTVSLDAVNTSGSAITINYTVGGTATSGSDFNALSGTVVIANGAQSNTILLTPINDTETEAATETVVVTLGTGTGYTVGSPNNATVNITSEDTAGVSINDISVNEGDGTATFTVTLNGAVFLGTIVSYTTANNTALAGSDYDAESGTVAFLGLNNETRTITIDISEDILVEGDETFFVNLTNATGFAQLGKTQGIGTIVDNDSYIASITATDADAAESPLDAGSFTVGLNTTNLTGSPIVISYIVNGTATPDSDYIALSGTVSIANGQESSSIAVTPINDTAVETGLETVIVNLATGTGYNVGVPSSATVNISSEDTAGVSINDILINEDDGTATFTVTLNANVPAGATVTYATANNTATAGTDYAAESGTLTFLGLNNEVQTIEIDILEDTVAEGTESFFVNLSNPIGLIQIDKAQGIGTIADNDNCIEAPLINSTSTIFCDAFTQDLDAYTDTAIPAGFELIWSSNSDFSITGARLSTSVVDFEATFYGFLFNSGTGCTSPPLEVTLVRNVPPEILSTTPATICGPGTATITATVSAGGSLFWYSSTADSLPLGEGSSFTTPNNAATTIYYVEALANECISERVAVTVTVASLVDAGVTTDDVACSITGGGPTTVDLDDTRTGGTAGVWTIVGTPPSVVTLGAGNVVDFEGAVDGDYVFSFTTNTAVSPCVDESVEVTITVSTCTMDSDGDGLIDRDEIALGLNPNNRDTDADGINDFVEVGPDVNNPIDTDNDGIIDALDSNILDSDNDDIVDQLDPANDNPCIPNISDACRIDLSIEKVVDKESILVGREVTFTITLTNLSPILVTNVAVNDLVSPALGFQYISSTVTKGVYNEIAGVWQLEEVLADEVNTLTITAMVPEVGTYQNIAAIVDSFPEDSNSANNSASASVTVTPRSTDECGFLFNQISPNGDGFNDAVYINCIEDYPNNNLEIYDRYGNEVFKASSYDNTWMGTGKNGDLPKGTYFYILDLGDGTDMRKGWIQIIR